MIAFTDKTTTVDVVQHSRIMTHQPDQQWQIVWQHIDHHIQRMLDGWKARLAGEVIVRKLFIARAKKLLAKIRGKWSGRISIMDAEANLDYMMLQNEGDNEFKETMQELTQRLERMSPWEQLKRQADMTDSMAKILSGKPMKMITV